MITHSSVIACVLLVDAAALLLYNVSGMCVTGHLGAVFRTVLETTRTLFVWLVDLLLFYTPLGMGKLGESWSVYSWIQAAGFVVLVAGTVVYGQGDEREAVEGIGAGLYDGEEEAADNEALLGGGGGRGAAPAGERARIGYAGWEAVAWVCSLSGFAHSLDAAHLPYPLRKAHPLRLTTRLPPHASLHSSRCSFQQCAANAWRRRDAEQQRADRHGRLSGQLQGRLQHWRLQRKHRPQPGQAEVRRRRGTYRFRPIAASGVLCCSGSRTMAGGGLDVPAAPCFGCRRMGTPPPRVYVP